MFKYYKYYLFLIVFVSACTNEEKENTILKPTLFSDLPVSKTGVDFVNNISNSKDFNIFNYRNYYNGGGVAIGDINNDGLADLFFTSNLGANKLYLNKGDFQFDDISQKAGIELPEKWSTGVTMIDINNDNYLDIYVCNAGYQKGSDQKNALFINQQNNTFTEEAEKYGLAQNDYSTHAAFFDYDRDGDLDVYLLNNSFIPVNTLNYSNKRNLRAKDWPVAEFLKGGGDKLLRNDGGTFKDVSEEAGILGSLIGFGLGTTVGDVNNDGFLDIYVSNDFFERDYLYINKGDGTFSEELENRIRHLSHSSMGADMADINNDGTPEIFVTDMLPDDDYRLKTTSTFDNINLRKLKVKNGFYNQFMHNTLQLNDGRGQFSEIAFYSDVAASDWSWGALMFDADNDSYNDLFVCNGILNDVIDQDFIDFFANDVIQKMVLTGTREKVDSIINKMPSVPLVNKFYLNNKKLKFKESAQALGITKPTFSNGAAYGDLDNDGDLDLVVSNVNQEAQIYKNNSQNNFIGFTLKYKNSNINGVGSKIQLWQNGKTLMRELIPSRGFQSSVDYKISMGLGADGIIDSAVVIWPGGERQLLDKYKTNQYNKIIFEKQKTLATQKSILKNSSVFTSVKHSFPEHMEDDFIDFYYERNIPVELSKEGPCLAKGDFNGDGLEDLYLGGAANQAPVLYKNTGSGYTPHQQTYFDKFKAFEDTYAVFFDCDGDKDLDLLVASGGNNVTYKKRAFRDRLYINKNGSFEIELNFLPPVSLNTSVIRPHDIDGDGDLDLFVGIRSIPGDYGVSPGSYIYLNNGKGRFLDVTKTVVPELKMAGMITDAIWADVLPQKGKELILVGEWMAPKILAFDKVKFEIVESELSKYSGWWQTVRVLDIDKDGDLDLLLGNMGENFYLKANEENPLLLWINDFDQNGSIEKLITQQTEGEVRPVMVKRDMVDQLPHLKKESLLHAEYAVKSMKDLFPKEALQSSIIKKVNYMSSAIALNEGNGQFKMIPLPEEVQLSCVNAILPLDVNKDGFEDLIIGGNNEYLLPQFSSLDACAGKLLLNDTKGHFTFVKNASSGLNFKGVVRELDIISYKNKPHVLTLINNKKPQLYSF